MFGTIHHSKNLLGSWNMSPWIRGDHCAWTQPSLLAVPPSVVLPSPPTTLLTVPKCPSYIIHIIRMFLPSLPSPPQKALQDKFYPGVSMSLQTSLQSLLPISAPILCSAKPRYYKCHQFSQMLMSLNKKFLLGIFLSSLFPLWGSSATCTYLLSKHL